MNLVPPMLKRISPCGAAGIPDVPGCPLEGVPPDGTPPGGAPDDVAAVAVATIVEAASDTAVGWWSGLE